jgi:hypothetical protein
VQRGENTRKISFLNYKSAALDQLSYAGVYHTKAVLASSSRVRRDPRPMRTPLANPVTHRAEIATPQYQRLQQNRQKPDYFGLAEATSF